MKQAPPEPGRWAVWIACGLTVAYAALHASMLQRSVWQWLEVLNALVFGQ